MCDYSLENVLSRPAAVADRLVTATFPNTITRGFAAADDPNTAVCLRPGTELAFERPVEYDHPLSHIRATVGATVARFREIEPHNRYAHHDALEFPDGTIVPLTRLIAGQQATVLQLPAEAIEAKAEDSAPTSRSYEVIS